VSFELNAGAAGVSEIAINYAGVEGTVTNFLSKLRACSVAKNVTVSQNTSWNRRQNDSFVVGWTLLSQRPCQGLYHLPLAGSGPPLEPPPPTRPVNAVCLLN